MDSDLATRMSDPLDLARRLRNGAGHFPNIPEVGYFDPLLREAAAEIERQHAEIERQLFDERGQMLAEMCADLTRLRAVEEAAMDVVAADLIDNVWLRDKWIPALRAALREKGAEK